MKEIVKNKDVAKLEELGNWNNNLSKPKEIKEECFVGKLCSGLI